MKYNSDEGWEYESHPDYYMVNGTCNSIITGAFTLSCNQDSYLEDTRPTHYDIFRHVVPDNHTYFAGNYRGSAYAFLKDYEVSISGYRGTHSSLVEESMGNFAQDLKHSIKQFKETVGMDSDINNGNKLLYYCHLLAFFFVKFLVIHPYANGNGHMARLLVWVLLKKEGIESNFWSVGDRPGTPKGVPLDDCIQSFRHGDREPLVKYFLTGILVQKDVTKELLGIA